MLALTSITCKRPRCGQTFRPKRLAQRYCSTSCRKADFKRRGRAEKSVPEASPAIVVVEKRPPALERATPPPAAPPGRDFQLGPTPGALQGDDYPLEFYKDGYPKLPACLNRRVSKGLS